MPSAVTAGLGALSYKTSSQMGQDKSDIPRKTSFTEDLSPLGVGPNGSGMGNSPSGNAGSGSEATPIGQWLGIEAKQKYGTAI